jgi:iron(III) transport system substrate-binding protein
MKRPDTPRLRARQAGRARRATLAWIVALVALLPAACGGDGRDVLIVYSPHGRDLLTHYEMAFEALHPEVDVQWVDMGSQEVLDRLRSERANPQADVWFGAPEQMFEVATEEGLLEPFRPTWADALPREARDPDGHWHGTYLTPEVLAYNEEAVSREEAPADWDDLLDPRWRGQVILREPMASGTMRTIFSHIIYRESEGTGDPTAGYQWLLRLDAQTREYALNPTLLYQKLARQEGLVTMWAMPDILALRATTGLPINYRLPEGGTPVVVDAVAVVSGSGNPEMARVFVEFVGNRESILEATERFFRIPARTDIPPEEFPDWLQADLPHIRPMEADRALLRERTSEWMRYWDDRIRRRGAREGY